MLRAACALGAVALSLLGAGSALASGPDIYRCVPADGSPAYTTPGTCRGEVLRREPLSRDEIAERWAIKNRGRPFTRCTAADGRYRMFVREDEACPSPTDARTLEYAARPPGAQAQDQKIVDAAVARLAAAEGRPAAAAPAAAQPAPALDTPVLAPRSTPSAASAAAPAAVASAIPAPSLDKGRSARTFSSKLPWLVLAVLAIWGVSRWRSRASADAKTAVSRRRSASPTPHSTPPAQASQPDAPAASTARASAQGDDTDMNQKAIALLAVLERPEAAAGLAGGLAFGKALQQARLDYSMDSLERVDGLLAKIKAKFASERAGWQLQPGVENFCLLIAFYLGEVISRQSNRPMQWYTQVQAAPMMPPDNPLPDERWARLVGVIAGSPCVPLGLIDDALVGDKAPAMTCKAYVERFVARTVNAPTPDMDENKRCADMLGAFFSDAPLYGGLAFREQLKQVQLDYSLSSLQRLDQLLRFLQPELKLPPGEFINDPPSQNFMRLAAFYIGMTVARLGQIPVKWLNFEQAKQAIGELEHQFETASVCLLGGRFYFPLGLVTEILLQPGAQRNIPAWAQQALQAAPPPMPSILRASLHADVASPLPEALQTAVQQAGFVAAYGMFMVEGGSSGAPTVYAPTANGGGVFRDFSFYDDGDAAFKAAHSLMEDNPDQLRYQVMSFDGYANLHTGRTDALTIELRVYGGAPPSGQVVFRMVVICPYRNANDAAGFAIFSPKLVECTEGSAAHGAIFKHFYQGVASYKADTFNWFNCLDERI